MQIFPKNSQMQQDFPNQRRFMKGPNGYVFFSVCYVNFFQGNINEANQWGKSVYIYEGTGCNYRVTETSISKTLDLFNSWIQQDWEVWVLLKNSYNVESGDVKEGIELIKNWLRLECAEKWTTIIITTTTICTIIITTTPPPVTNITTTTTTICHYHHHNHHHTICHYHHHNHHHL